MFYITGVEEDTCGHSKKFTNYMGLEYKKSSLNVRERSVITE
jgi:hypothetical protein